MQGIASKATTLLCQAGVDQASWKEGRAGRPLIRYTACILPRLAQNTLAARDAPLGGFLNKKERYAETVSGLRLCVVISAWPFLGTHYVVRQIRASTMILGPCYVCRCWLDIMLPFAH